ncbi:MAG: hypothetical protein OEV64_03680 [Desulfobulbaceae bacterium]|nr:hypothetical protein [Desulfobulbaceae bacterium]
MITKTIIMRVGGGIMEIPRVRGQENFIQKDTTVEVPQKQISRVDKVAKDRPKRPSGL